MTPFDVGDEYKSARRQANISTKSWYNQTINKHPVRFHFPVRVIAVCSKIEIVLMSSITSELSLAGKFRWDADDNFEPLS